MSPGNWYTASIWVKTDGEIQIRAYTANNSEKGRLWQGFETVKKADGWKRVEFTFMDPKDSKSDSLSYNWSGLSPKEKMWLCCPQLEHAKEGMKAAKPFTSRTCDKNKGGAISTTAGVVAGQAYMLEWKERHRPGHAIRAIKVDAMRVWKLENFWWFGLIFSRILLDESATVS